MKLTAIILLAACLAASAKGLGQQVTLSVKDAALPEVFRQIRQQTGYNFLYNDAWLADAKKVTISVNKVPLTEVLELCFKDQPFSWAIVEKTISFKPKPTVVLQPTVIPPVIPESPRPIDITGRVVDSTGAPLIGASVRVKGTKQGTTTDANGNFILKGVADDATIEISYQGYELYSVKANANIGTVSLKMKPNEMDVVTIEANTGYQKIKPNEQNGSVVIIDSKMLNQQTGTNILQRLDGIANGLVFNIGKTGSTIGVPSKTNISIRGISTINGPLDPLIVLDNFIYDGDINNINPNDVESITILKDGAATSIYGAQGGNGVIVITTKRGRFNQRLRVNFSANTIISDKKNLYSLPVISSSDYINVEEFLFNNGYFNNTINANSPMLALTPAVEVFLKRRNGSMSPADSALQIDRLKSLDSREYYNQYLNERPIIQQYSMNFSGGSNNQAWHLAGNYDKSKTSNNLKNDRVNLRFSNSYKISRALQINLSSSFTSNSFGGNAIPQYDPVNGISVNGRKIPYLQFADENGNPLPVATIYRAGYIDTLGSGKLLDWRYFPLTDSRNISTKSNREDILLNLGLTYKIIRGLDMEVSYQYQKQNSTNRRIATVDSWEARDLINRFSILTRDAFGKVVNVNRANLPLGGILTASNSSVKSQNFRTQLNYNNSWVDHAVSAIGGVEIRETVTDFGNQSTIYGYSEDPHSYSTVDYVNTYPNVFGGMSLISGAPTTQPKTNYRFVSIYSNAVYTYKERYAVNLSLRRDGSNIFGAETNDKWKPLWSAGFGWDISKGKFYKFSLLQSLRLKATIGQSGNVDLRRSPNPILTYSPADPYTGLPFGTVLVNDPTLRWERGQMINIGIQFSSKKQIISGSIEYYKRKVKDLYGLAAVDYSTGPNNYVIKNVANMEGQGVDLQLNTININKGFKWETSWILNHNTNKVTSYLSREKQPIVEMMTSSMGNQIIPVAGKPVYGIVAFKWGGLDAVGDPQGFVNGQLSKDYVAITQEAGTKGIDGNIKYIGPATPVIWGSLLNQFNWKGFTASLSISYKLGYYFRRPSINYATLINEGIGHSDFARRWQKPGDEKNTNVPALVYLSHLQFEQRNYFYLFSEVNVLKAGNIRLQFVNLSYSVPSNKEKLPFNNIQLFLNVSNLGIIWRANKEKIDPDYPSSFAQQKSFTLGIRTTF